MDWAVIFDVDGVLLELTAPEEEAFFTALAELHGLTGLSRDWNSYPIRNDREIIRHILSCHFCRPAQDHEVRAVEARYLELLASGITSGTLKPTPIPAADELLVRLAGHVTGIATANLLPAARLRLTAAGITHSFAHACGAESGGAKTAILGCLAAQSGVPRERLIYIGDNLNDLAAGAAHAGLFIGFSTDATQRRRLAAAGARLVAGSHAETWEILSDHVA